MTVAESFDLFYEQHRNNLDRFLDYLNEIPWDLNTISVTSKGYDEDMVLTVRRPDGKKRRINVLTYLCLIRYAGAKIKDFEHMLEGGKDGTD